MLATIHVDRCDARIGRLEDRQTINIEVRARSTSAATIANICLGRVARDEPRHRRNHHGGDKQPARIRVEGAASPPGATPHSWQKNRPFQGWRREQWTVLEGPKALERLLPQ